MKDPKVGGFEIKMLLNEKYSKIREEIENFLVSTKHYDFILLYFLYHGIKNKGIREKNRLNYAIYV